MNSYREDDSLDPNTPATSSAVPWTANGPGPAANPPGSPDRQQLATGRRDTWLYRISPPGAGGVYWEAGMKLDGKVLQRRFAAELHARAWLTTVNEPHPGAVPFDLEEHRGWFRAAALLRGR